MTKSIIINCLISTVTAVLLSACNNPAQTPKATQNSSSPPPVSLTELLQRDNLIALIKDGQILIVDPESAHSLPVHKLSTQQTPPSNELFDVQISPEKNYLVWYSPISGFLKFSLSQNKVETVRPPNNWLNNNPFFAFDRNQDILFLVDNEGADFISIDLKNSQQSVTKIPFPFGNQFKVSPDGKKILFISGFGQAQSRPLYMVTSIDGSNPVRFSTSGLLNLRNLVDWFPDSTNIIAIEKDNQVVSIPSSDPSARTVFFNLGEGHLVTDMRVVNQNIFILQDEARWFVIDAVSAEKKASIPLEIAEGLYKPHFIGWHNDKFLLEEVIRIDNKQFSRLWLTNFIGIKKTVVDQYHQLELSTNIAPI